MGEAEAVAYGSMQPQPQLLLNWVQPSAQVKAEGHYVLMDKPPVKLKRHIDRILGELLD